MTRLARTTARNHRDGGPNGLFRDRRLWPDFELMRSKKATSREVEVVGRARQEEGRAEKSDGQTSQSAEAGRGRRREGRLAARADALLRPWWERDPGLLGVEINGLQRLGFRVRRRVIDDGRLALTASQDERQYEIRYPFAFPDESPVVGDGTLSDPDARFVVPFGPAPVGSLGIDELERDRPREYQRLAKRFNVLLPLMWSLPSKGEGGTLRLGAGCGPSLAALELTGVANAERLRSSSLSLASAFPRPVSGWWISGPAPDWSNDDEDIVDEVEKRIAHFRRVPLIRARFELRFGIGALAYASGGAGGETEWLFVRRTSLGEPVIGRVELWRPSASLARSPFGDALRDKRVAVIGCGALGWGVTMSLARAGVGRFSLFDGDFVHPSNLPRLAARIGYAGEDKVAALADEIRQIAPTAVVDPVPSYVGRTVGASALINSDPDLLIDASADSRSPHETNLAAVALERPALFAWTSNGVVEARIFRVVPGRTACYACVRDAEPRPLRSARLLEGWAEEFVWNGANFNLESIASATARMAVRTLLGHPVDRTNPDHVVVSIGHALPRVRELMFPRVKDCEICG